MENPQLEIANTLPNLVVFPAASFPVSSHTKGDQLFYLVNLTGLSVGMGGDNPGNGISNQRCVLSRKYRSSPEHWPVLFHFFPCRDFLFPPTCIHCKTDVNLVLHMGWERDASDEGENKKTEKEKDGFFTTLFSERCDNFF
ncbi:hypothetical protein CDAR_400901 [Caerostris darwini]|uniref:Uncharacterized protein n=1 Tax=Caerostris darwini TaxID=1538125 RepID=A0AAV4TKK9_9ARAC|nr:hypothetical protein CDAR_400901 [Caerostris darwini]